jgi:hypothetical protein
VDFQEQAHRLLLSFEVEPVGKGVDPGIDCTHAEHFSP